MKRLLLAVLLLAATATGAHAQAILRNSLNTNTLGTNLVWDPVGHALIIENNSGSFSVVSNGLTIAAISPTPGGNVLPALNLFQYLQFNSSTNRLKESGTNLVWNNQAVMTGSGTANRLTRWTGTSTVGNSGFTDDGANTVSLPNTYIQALFPDGSTTHAGIGFTAQDVGLSRFADGAVSVIAGTTRGERVRIDSTAAAFFVPIAGTTGSGLTKTNLVATDGNTNLAMVTIGTGLAFDGTTRTLSSTASGGVTTQVTPLAYSGTNITGFSCLTNNATYTLTLTNHCLFDASTFTGLPNTTTNMFFTLGLKQDSAGGYVPKFTNSIIAWADGNQPVIKTNANAVSYLYFHTHLFTNGMLVGSPNINVQ